jgi:hypothetical protein
MVLASAGAAPTVAKAATASTIGMYFFMFFDPFWFQSRPHAGGI